MPPSPSPINCLQLSFLRFDVRAVHSCCVCDHSLVVVAHPDRCIPCQPSLSPICAAMASAASSRRKQPLPLPKHCRRHSPAADEAVDVKDERVEVQLRRRHSTRSPTQPDRRRRRQKVDANQAEESPSQIPVPSSPAEENEMKEEVTKEEAAELPAQQSSHSWLPQPLPLAAALVPPPPWHRHSQPGRAVFACVYP